MTPAPNPFATRTFTAPPGMEDEVDALEVLQNGGMHISCWEPSDEEIEAIKAGERIWLYVMANAQPPVGMTVGDRPVCGI